MERSLGKVKRITLATVDLVSRPYPVVECLTSQVSATSPVKHAYIVVPLDLRGAHSKTYVYSSQCLS